MKILKEGKNIVIKKECCVFDDILISLGIMSQKKKEIIKYILNISKNGFFKKSQRKIAKEVGVTLKVVYDTFKVLKNAGLLEYKGKGIYELNVDVFLNVNKILVYYEKQFS